MYKLTNMLRGERRQGDGAVQTLTVMDFSPFIPPICFEAADRIEDLEREVKTLKETIKKLREKEKTFE